MHNCIQMVYLLGFVDCSLPQKDCEEFLEALTELVTTVTERQGSSV